MHTLRAGEHVQCLDVVRVAFRSGTEGVSLDCAILLEIWDDGAPLQTSLPILAETPISLESIGDGISAKVISCEEDSYGFLLQVAVGASRWFPEAYTPPHVMWPELAR
jgi:hypothetical protein